MKKFASLLIALLITTFAFSQTKTEIKTSQLPKGVSAYLAKNFSTFRIEKAFKIDNKGEISTEVRIARGKDKFDFTFDKDAKLVKKEVIKPDGKAAPGKDVNKQSPPPKDEKKPDPVKK